MNKVILMGRFARDPEVRYSQNANSMAIARYTLAVDREVKSQDGQQDSDFISCVVFGKGAEFVEKYFHKGSKVLITGHIQTGSYTNRDGQKIYTTDVIVDKHEFVDSKSSQNSGQNYQQPIPQTPTPQQIPQPQTVPQMTPQMAQQPVQMQQGYTQPVQMQQGYAQPVQNQQAPFMAQQQPMPGFVAVPDNVGDEGLPFN